MPKPLRFKFIAKIIATLVLVAAADVSFQDRIGSWLGGLALAWAAILPLVRPATQRGAALIAAAAAGGFAIALANNPGPLAWILFWTAISMAALLPRTAGFDDAWRWAVRLAAHAVTGPFSPIADLIGLLRPRARGKRPGLRGMAGTLALPIAASALFVALFASANPLIGRALADIRFPSVGELLFWLFAFAVVWPSLRPRAWATRIASLIPEAEFTLPGASPTSVLIALGMFNIVFAVQNVLDIAFLWSGAPLPDGITLASYAHRGAYPLIATALLAGVFVLATLKPGSPTAANPLIRRLVIFWVGQNLLLVASSILRTCDYIGVYMLTAWRIAALIWMGLVALGVMLICWRMLTGRSARWLINSNALAAAVMLAAASVIDLDAISARWNVAHAREVGGRGVALDLCQLNAIGSSALLPLIDLEAQPLNSAFRDRVRSVRQQIMAGNGDWQPGLVQTQADWRSWTWRDARRLAEAKGRSGDQPAAPMALPPGALRNCDGSIQLPPPPARPALQAMPLTGKPPR